MRDHWIFILITFRCGIQYLLCSVSTQMVDINLAMMNMTAANIESILMATNDAHNHLIELWISITCKKKRRTFRAFLFNGSRRTRSYDARNTKSIVD